LKKDCSNQQSKRKKCSPQTHLGLENKIVLYNLQLQINHKKNLTNTQVLVLGCKSRCKTTRYASAALLSNEEKKEMQKSNINLPCAFSDKLPVQGPWQPVLVRLGAPVMQHTKGGRTGGGAQTGEAVAVLCS
jgi:hypothetical protein